MGFAGGGHERASLVLAFLVFKIRFTVDDDTGTGLNVDFLVLDDGGAQRNAGIHRTVGRDIADTARIDATPHRFQFINDFHGADFGGP